MFGFLKDKVKSVIEKVTGPSEKKVSEKKKPEKKAPEKKVPKKEATKEKPTKPERKKEEVKEKKEEKGFLGGLFAVGKVSDRELEELKLELVRANVSFEAAEKIIGGLRGVEKRNFKSALKNQLVEVLGKEKFDFFHFVKHRLKEKNSVTVLFFGFNGSGKTTTVAKVGHLLKKNNIPVVFAAGDTFRAAAIEQLSAHAQNLGIDIVKHKYGGDPAAVIFDARKHAEKIHGVVLGDTAGRLHTDKNLMEELKKVMRVNNPDFRILVIDSLTGSDVMTQVQNFSEIGFDGLILTKADVNEKGGSIFSVRQITDKPIIFLGTGQGYDDLMEFDPEKIVEKLDL